MTYSDEDWSHPAMMERHNDWTRVSDNELAQLRSKESTYKGSWRKRGGVGAFMMLARKWDRIENYCSEVGWDILSEDIRTEALLEEITDLRNYLMLIKLQRMRNEDADEPGPHYIDPDKEGGDR